MPGLDGLKVTEWIRRHPTLDKLPLIIITSDAEDESQETAIRLGADDYLIKPIKAPLALARVNAVFRRLGNPIN